MSPDRRPYRTSDGYISVIVYNDKQWNSFFDVSGRQDLRSDPVFATFAGRLANIDKVYAELGRIFTTKTTAEWMQLLNDGDIPSMPVHDLLSILEDPHLVKTNFFPIAEHPSEGAIRSMRVATTWSDTPAQPSRLAPNLGQHSREILREIGFGDEEITRLVNDGVVRTTTSDNDNNQD
jgi:formyl-CoA transferase